MMGENIEHSYKQPAAYCVEPAQNDRLFIPAKCWPHASSLQSLYRILYMVLPSALGRWISFGDMPQQCTQTRCPAASFSSETAVLWQVRQRSLNGSVKTSCSWQGQVGHCTDAAGPGNTPPRAWNWPWWQYRAFVQSCI